MSYNPQPGGNTDASGGNETRNMSETPGGSPTMPTGGYTPPPPPAGGYAPPPPPPSGGYTPPPQGGYTPPPAGGPGMTGGAGAGKGDIQGLTQRYMNIISKTDSKVYDPEIGKANSRDTLIGVGIAAVANAISGFIGGLIGAAAFGSMLGSNAGAVGVGSAFVGAILSFILTFATFYAGSYITFFVARQFFQGQGTDFGTHSYLLSLSYAPLRTIAALLNIIPVIGGLLAIIPRLYQYYHSGLAVQSYHKTDVAKGQMSVWIPVILGFVLSFILAAILAALAISAIGGLGNIR